MSLMDDLRNVDRSLPGHLCAFQRIKATEGEARFLEVMEVVWEPTRTATDKIRVLHEAGYTHISAQVVSRHAKHRLAEHACMRCSVFA